MPAYFASDVHLRLDRPERAARFARWVDRLRPDDSLTVVGDLCDFWFAARQVRNDPTECPGLRALASYRARGGTLAIMPGNHDIWLGPFYERTLGVDFLSEPLTRVTYGLRLLLVHGHDLGGRHLWKAWMESQTFHNSFGRLPNLVADRLDQLLERTNERHRDADDMRHLAVYRRYAAQQSETADIVIVGHIHRPLDEPGHDGRPRLIVLGGWHRQSSYVRVDEQGASLIVEPDPARSIANLIG